MPETGQIATAPVVLIVFNRPDVTRRTLERIREAAPSELLLIADGPRAGNDDDVAKCAAVRRELEAIDWPCRVRRRYSDQNLGLVGNIEGGLDWAFEQVTEAIILEDDCLPNRDFFRFCSELLDRYREADEVWQIAGRAPLAPPADFRGASYVFTATGPIWGWATWRRAWNRHQRYREDPKPPPAASKLRTRAARRYFGDVAKDRELTEFGWASRWLLSIVRGGGLVILPEANLIDQIGFGPEATNTVTPLPHRELESMRWPLSHPTEFWVNPDLDRWMERILASHHGRAARIVARRLAASPRLRRVARTAVGAWRDRQLRTR